MTKQDLYNLVDVLPEQELIIARRFLEFLIQSKSDPMLRALMNAPADDEPITHDDLKAIDEAKQDIQQKRVQSLEDVKAELLSH